MPTTVQGMLKMTWEHPANRKRADEVATRLARTGGLARSLHVSSSQIPLTPR